MKRTVLASLLGLAACGGRSPAPDAPVHNTAPSAAATGTVRGVDWANRTYELGEWGTYTLKDGNLQLAYDQNGEPVAPDYQPTNPDEYIERGEIAVREPVYGDLTGDGAEEAAIVTYIDGGGTGKFTDIAIFAMRGGREVMIGGIPGGDRGDGGIIDVAIDGGAVRVDRYLSIHGGACCPEQIAHERWTWDGKDFVEDEHARTMTANPETY